MAHRVEVARDLAACAATVPVQRALFGDAAVVPPDLLFAATRNGGFVALGYADGDSAPGAIVFGFLGIYDYHFRHHSHAIGVLVERRRRGLALALKEAQRDHCLDQGVEVMTWYADPLDVAHIAFSVARLGAYARALEGERLYVEWPIGADRTYRRLRREDVAPSLEDAERDGIAYVTEAEPDGTSRYLVDLGARNVTLRALAAAFARGYAAVEFLRSADGRAAYLIVPQPRRDPAED